MKSHNLKTLPKFFSPIADGRKTFEIRRDDRGFALGDELILQEWDPSCKRAPHECYTGSVVNVRVTYITTYEQKPGFVVMAVTRI